MMSLDFFSRTTRSAGIVVPYFYSYVGCIHTHDYTLTQKCGIVNLLPYYTIIVLIPKNSWEGGLDNLWVKVYTISMGRPKGSKSKKHDGYSKRTRELKEHYGDDIFRKWGKRGGNPALVRENK